MARRHGVESQVKARCKRVANQKIARNSERYPKGIRRVSEGYSKGIRWVFLTPFAARWRNSCSSTAALAPLAPLLTTPQQKHSI
jgi:hypothetical protein